ncbi:hypothetical protein WN944_015617 [Citrus x changshan-huyou]|uniref:R13L1/DRL21-like LRR repeat region domain-containing protein n=1 Tax=Citrus x changshan-huyou TaxID=2935761 RepID=A0AAP0QMU4_9ROSI
MPPGMKELKCLQTLSNFIVSKGKVSTLTDLKNLNFLGGELSISGLENVDRDTSFSKMEVLKLENCENCTSLPSLGLLSSLKHLTIKGLMKLKSMGAEVYGEDCSKPFQSLEILCFENLPEWEYWDTKLEENDIVAGFSSLRELSMDCVNAKNGLMKSMQLRLAFLSWC